MTTGGAVVRGSALAMAGLLSSTGPDDVTRGTPPPSSALEVTEP
jgi:hypothetical protein